MPSYFVVNQTNGVKFIKIHSIDSGGLDQSNYLRNIQNLTLKYPDRSDVTYPVVGIQELGSYFLYSIGPYTPGSMTNFNTSSAGDINNYIVSFTTSSSPGWTIPSGVNNPESYINYTVTSGNALGYFTASSGVYLPGQTPNTKLTLAGNLDYTTSGPPDPKILRFYLHNGTIDKDTSVFFTASLAGPGPAGTTFTSTNIDINPLFIEGSPVYISLYVVSGTVTLTALTFNLTQSPSEFNGSSSLTLIDPYVSNFDYNEYNVLLNNAETPRKSVHFMDIDYSQNPLTPVNQYIILSGSADKAPVPDSNYTSKAWSNIRYNGTKYNSIKLSF